MSRLCFQLRQELLQPTRFHEFWINFFISILGLLLQLISTTGAQFMELIVPEMTGLGII